MALRDSAKLSEPVRLVVFRDALARALFKARPFHGDTMTEQFRWEKCIHHVAGELAKTNREFDLEQFIAACHGET